MAQQEKQGPEGPQTPPRELTKEEKAEIRTGTAIRNMVATDGWKVYQKILEIHLQGKRNEFEEPAETKLDGISQVLRSESAKGAIMGLRLALSIPGSILDNDKILRKNLGLATSGDDDAD
jgi:hypothetical protein